MSKLNFNRKTRSEVPNYNISFDKDYMSNIEFEFKTIEKENNKNVRGSGNS